MLKLSVLDTVFSCTTAASSVLCTLLLSVPETPAASDTKVTQAVVFAGPANTVRVAECSVARPRTEGPAKGESLPGVS